MKTDNDLWKNKIPAIARRSICQQQQQQRRENSVRRRRRRRSGERRSRSDAVLLGAAIKPAVIKRCSAFNGAMPLPLLLLSLVGPLLAQHTGSSEASQREQPLKDGPRVTLHYKHTNHSWLTLRSKGIIGLKLLGLWSILASASAQREKTSGHIIF